MEYSTRDREGVVVDVSPARLVDATQERTSRSPLLDNLALDAGSAALLRTVEAWEGLAEYERQYAPTGETMGEVLAAYLAPPTSTRDLKPAYKWYVHHAILTSDDRFYKPTHFKQRLATDDTLPEPMDTNLGYRLLQHEYRHARALRGDLESLAQGKFHWAGVTDPNYVFRPHNHGQSMVSYFRRGGMVVTEWRFPDELPNELSRSTQKADWQELASLLVRREVEYGEGDVMWLHGDEVHALREIEGGTITLIAEMPTIRRHSVTFDEQPDGTLTPRDIFPTRGADLWSLGAYPNA